MKKEEKQFTVVMSGTTADVIHDLLVDLVYDLENGKKSFDSSLYKEDLDRFVELKKQLSLMFRSTFYCYQAGEKYN